ncbi:CDGSH iron-sulfur domain-containing protein 2 homolog [Daktulosphaira vitifoliae]|uniref:CDGSH iron-sulfur domain-containing protein 2 homolog n=1 Tax=Daktulosphaira vitifoliae TaxID=58002 RepID=UPI0021AAD8C0|nr:CDGSH iron-sulfur domain-containing protein 2 homolog [Daktulosphaira vitifoliae]XP_050520296.1 CDGSH iron-sulfur domain-containing protein 2 homolog [Daktulosphaira vitifoliae]
MEASSNLIKVHLANYLANLPLPNSFTGIFKLGISDIVKLIPFYATVGGVCYISYRFVCPRSPVNPSIKKESSKVADVFAIEELGDSTAFCRCWRSSKFPLCDGAHNVYNKLCQDNVGPLIVKNNK